MHFLKGLFLTINQVIMHNDFQCFERGNEGIIFFIRKSGHTFMVTMASKEIESFVIEKDKSIRRLLRRRQERGKEEEEGADDHCRGEAGSTGGSCQYIHCVTLCVSQELSAQSQKRFQHCQQPRSVRSVKEKMCIIIQHYFNSR